MEPNRRLTYYRYPKPLRSRLHHVTARDLRKELLAFLGLWLLGIVLTLGLPTECFDPNSYLVDPYVASQGLPDCTGNFVERDILECGFIALGIIVLGIVLYLHGGPSELVLMVTRDGIASPYSRFPDPIVSWASIASLAIYEDASHAGAERRPCYLAVTVHSSDGLHDLHELETVWRRYSYMPDVDHVAIMAPLEDVFPNADAEQILLDMIEPIQALFADEIAEYNIVLAGSVRRM